MPVITEVTEARRNLSLAALSAIAHADDPGIGAILETMSAALEDSPRSVAAPLTELIGHGLGNRSAAQQWWDLMAVDFSFRKSGD
ncbi:hypothetical protein AB0M87_11780 [Streptomyces sp. NPDC051320]|uniref:hypothetical protein n=1 Tax=Streptomyces sp. NPDC051320 TaxID=3154644 RepID=UPI0034475D32